LVPERPQSDGPQGHGAVETHVEKAGVDLSLIRWMLRLTPAERLKVLDQRLVPGLGRISGQ
jgi:hypothetical protein